jgi:riboflavin kinase/FMN adenylyltransferase
MQHYYGLQEVALKDAWLTIGSFDGLHIGHRQIIEKLTAGAHEMGAPAVVLTFYPHPAMVLRGPRESFYLTMPEEKAALLGEAGIDAVITYPFDLEVSQVSARTFIGELRAHLKFRQLWVGHDFALGREREGDAAMLARLGAEMGFEVKAIEAYKMEGEVVSSSRVRRLLAAGDVTEAARLLGRPYKVRGEVVQGDRRGRTIGIPTANMALPEERAVPKAGVYACQVLVGEKWYQAVTNVGVRPTFEHEPVAPRVEAHLLDFEGDIYGQEIEMQFAARLRDEVRFSGVEELKAQIAADIQRAREILEGA